MLRIGRALRFTVGLVLLGVCSPIAGSGLARSNEPALDAEIARPWMGHFDGMILRIGRETVTYVSNIFEYYVAYKLVVDEQNEHARAREQAAPRQPGGP